MENQIIERYYQWAIGAAPCPYPQKKEKQVQASVSPTVRPKRLNCLQIQAAIEQKMAEIKSSKKLKFS